MSSTCVTCHARASKCWSSSQEKGTCPNVWSPVVTQRHPSIFFTLEGVRNTTTRTSWISIRALVLRTLSSKAYNDSCGGNVGAQKETVSIWYVCHSIMLSLNSVVYGIPLWIWFCTDMTGWFLFGPVHGRLTCQCYLQLVSLSLFCSISSLHLNPEISNGWWI